MARRSSIITRHGAALPMKTSSAVLCGCVLAVVAVAGAKPPAGWQSFVAAYRQALPTCSIVGSSVAFVEHGAITARDDYGLRDRSANLPVNEDTIFHWASITKTFTAIGIVQLRDRGLITLDDPVVKYVPELRRVHNPFGPMDAITIRQLLSHSAGFRDGTWPWAGEEDWQPFEPPGWEQLVGMMPYTRVEFASGSKYSYSNPGYVYLGRVIEDVTREPFETYIDKEILRPLGMTRAFFDRAPSFLRGDRSHSYFVDDDGVREARFDFDTGITVMNGGLNAPVADMAKYLGLLQGAADATSQARYDGIIARASLEEMWRPVAPVSPGVQMGLGFFLEEHGGRSFVAHSGGQNGFISHFYVDRASRKGAVIAFNTQTTSKAQGDARSTRALDAAMRDEMMDRLFE
jgi:CubicO group peptidase (beta-lactamase class C family)